MTAQFHDAPGLIPPRGHYSHVALAGGLAFIAGQLPVTPQGTPLAGAPFADQVAQTLANVDDCLTAVGLGRRDLVQVRVFVTDLAQWGAFDALYSAWLGDHRPARLVAGVAELHYGVALEIEAVATAGR